MKKIICLSLALIMMLMAVSACTGNTDGPADTVDTDEIAPIGEFLDVIRDGECKVTFVYPARNETLFNEVERAAININNKFKVLPNCVIDTNKEEGDYEILVGLTNRPESATAYERLERTNDYICELSGKKLVIVGKTDASTVAALMYFMFKCINGVSSTTETAFSAEFNTHFIGNYSVKATSVGETPLDKLTIVYPKDSTLGEYYTALSLRYHFYKNAGYDIPVIDDSVAASGKEIVIGNTSRGRTPEPEKDKYGISVSDGNLYVSADSLFGFIGACDYLTETLFSKNTATIAPDFSYTADADKIPERSGDFRVMFNNVWGLYVPTDNAYYANRDEYASAWFLAYMPDVIALNELWDGYRAEGVLTDTLTKNGYVEVIAPVESDKPVLQEKAKTNVLPIFYNPERVKLVESRYTHYEWYNGDTVESGTTLADDSKGVTIAVFEGLDENGNGNGKRFIVCNTHFTSNHKNPAHGKISRLLNIETAWNELQYFLEKYPDASVIMGCDYNASVTSDEVKKIVEYGFVNSHDEAEEKNDIGSSHGYPVYNDILGFYTTPSYSQNTKYESSIDHIYRYGNTIEEKYFETMTNDYTAMFSDHSPLLLEFNVIEPAD